MVNMWTNSSHWLQYSLCWLFIIGYLLNICYFKINAIQLSVYAANLQLLNIKTKNTSCEWKFWRLKAIRWIKTTDSLGGESWLLAQPCNVPMVVEVVEMVELVELVEMVEVVVVVEMVVEVELASLHHVCADIPVWPWLDQQPVGVGGIRDYS